MSLGQAVTHGTMDSGIHRTQEFRGNFPLIGFDKGGEVLLKQKLAILHVRLCFKSFTHMESFNNQNNSVTQVQSLPHFSNEEMKTLEDKLICPGHISSK
jgi:hypothetical protein